jgi:Protein of unknown function DUF262/Protein of unknown function (DUF1524)
MVRNPLLDTRTTSFGELVGNGNIYQVPPFQRDYAWQAENWEDLWQDIVAIHETKAFHFMGAIVTQTTVTQTTVTQTTDQKDARLPFTIIDGQQRLATLSILAIAVLEKLNQLVEKGIEPEANRDRQEILRRTYLGDRDARSLRYSSKLLLNENNNGFYQDNLINLRSPRNLYVLTQSERLLWQAFEYFSNKLKIHPNLSTTGASLADLLTDTVAQRLLFIQISVEDETNAYVLFETLNSRGTKLGATDLLKNYLFSLLRGPDDYYAGQREWQRIVRTVGMEKFPAFLKTLLSTAHLQVRHSQLFKLTRKNVSTAEQAFTLLSQLSEHSNLYVALGNSNDDFWNLYPNSRRIRKRIKELALFGTQQVYPVLLAAYQKFSDQDFEKLLKLLNVLVFRHTVVSQLNPNELENQSNSLAVSICNDDIKTPRAAFNALSSLYVSDGKFQQDFSVLSISTQKHKDIAKYILNSLEKEAAHKEIDIDSFSIEHILPQEPTEEWRQVFDSRQLDDMIYRLGNMTPLESTLNRSIGREPYPEKRVAYLQSAYTMTQQIQAEDWTADSIARRQEHMAKQAVHIWRIDY